MCMSYRSQFKNQLQDTKRDRAGGKAKIRKSPHWEMVQGHLRAHLREFKEKESSSQSLLRLRKRLLVSFKTIDACLENLARFYVCHLPLHRWHDQYGKSSIRNALRYLGAVGLVSKKPRPIPLAAEYRLRPLCKTCEALFYPTNPLTYKDREQIEFLGISDPAESISFDALLAEVDKRRNTKSLKNSKSFNTTDSVVSKPKPSKDQYDRFRRFNTTDPDALNDRSRHTVFEFSIQNEYSDCKPNLKKEIPSDGFASDGHGFLQTQRGQEESTTTVRSKKHIPAPRSEAPGRGAGEGAIAGAMTGSVRDVDLEDVPQLKGKSSEEALKKLRRWRPKN